MHWSRYHFEKQPHKICKKCFVVDHDDSACEAIAKNLKVVAYNPKEFWLWCQNDPEGQALVASLEEEDRRLNQDKPKILEIGTSSEPDENTKRKSMRETENNS
ncbi:hypothetical protein C5167_018905 [Papaver somniferum]|uniref:Uncharacterized protein n=1 Tax=Papaver somniferum TaxID=3469 RepID=A0A4Y7INM0_PAPSO|nr:hypothetical protein C5167_018905 [Papaver somniferum]